MEVSVVSKCERLVERYNTYEHYHDPAVWLTVGAIIASIAIFMWGGKEGDPSLLEFRIVAAIVFFGPITIAYVLRRKSQRYLVTLAEKSALHAFVAHEHLARYSEKGLEADKNEAIEAIKTIVDDFDSKWAISDKTSKHLLEDFDYLMNPVIKLMLLLKNSILPIIEEGQQTKTSELASYLEKLTIFFLHPSDTLLNDLFEMKRPSPSDKEDNGQSTASLSGYAVKRHVAVFSGATIVSILVFLALLQYSKGDVFQPLGIALTTGFGISGIYVAFLRK